jgi:hypothetical protein
MVNSLSIVIFVGKKRVLHVCAAPPSLCLHELLSNGAIDRRSTRHSACCQIAFSRQNSSPTSMLPVVVKRHAKRTDVLSTLQSSKLQMIPLEFVRDRISCLPKITEAIIERTVAVQNINRISECLFFIF